MDNTKKILIGLVVLGGGLVGYSFWKNRKKGIVWKPGDKPLEVQQLLSDDPNTLTFEELNVSKDYQDKLAKDFLKRASLQP